MTAHRYLLALIAVTAVGRLYWMAVFCQLSWRQPGVYRMRERLQRLRKDMRLPPRLRGDAPEKIAAVRDRYDLFKTQLTVAYTLGGLAFTGWSVLLATAKTVDHFTLAVLASSVLVALAGPMLFRTANGEGTRMGYETCLSISGFLLIVAILALARTLFSDKATLTALIALPAAFTWREIAEVRAQLNLTRTQLF